MFSSLVDEHINKMKKLLKTLVIIKTKFYNYAKQYIIGKEFDAMTIIDNR